MTEIVLLAIVLFCLLIQVNMLLYFTAKQNNKKLRHLLQQDTGAKRKYLRISKAIISMPERNVNGG